MSLNAYNLSAGLFIRGLNNLQGLLTKAQAHATTNGSGEDALLNAPLAADGPAGGLTAEASHDLHRYTLAQQVHWAAEGAKLAVARLLNVPAVPATNDAKNFADLHQRLDTTIAYLREVAASDLEAGLDRTIVIEHRRGSMTFNGGQFLREFAIPHFYYHLTTAYGILRNQGVNLTMGDFLGGWGGRSKLQA
jgi:hypothetical protein